MKGEEPVLRSPTGRCARARKGKKGEPSREKGRMRVQSSSKEEEMSFICGEVSRIESSRVEVVRRGVVQVAQRRDAEARRRARREKGDRLFGVISIGRGGEEE